VTGRLVNVPAQVHARLRLPTRSNGIKDLARARAARGPDASGLRSQVGRARREVTRDDGAEAESAADVQPGGSRGRPCSAGRPGREESRQADGMALDQHGPWRGGRRRRVRPPDRAGHPRRPVQLPARLDLACHKDAGNPITRNSDRLDLADESYCTPTGGPAPGAGAGHPGRGPAAPAPVLDGRARPGPAARARPRALHVDVRRPALPGAPAPQAPPGRPRSRRTDSGSRPARGRLRPVNHRRQGRKDPAGSGPTTAAVYRTRPTQEQEDLDLRREGPRIPYRFQQPDPSPRRLTRNRSALRSSQRAGAAKRPSGSTARR
jgi:hypothetical protein